MFGTAEPTWGVAICATSGCRYDIMVLRGTSHMKSLAALALLVLSLFVHADDKPVLVEAESFKDRGGWVLDTQFVHIMGSPYLMAHGMGTPVADATTPVTFPSTGQYKV